MSDRFDLHNYDDIIDLPHHVSPNRRRMSNVERGAQFSPFAALTGYGAAVEEAARLTETEEGREPTEERAAALDASLRALAERLATGPAKATVTCFRPDEKKSGGAYVRVTGTVRELDLPAGILVLADRTRLPLEQIRDIRLEPDA